jgi:hypothetical protein
MIVLMFIAFFVVPMIFGLLHASQKIGRILQLKYMDHEIAQMRLERHAMLMQRRTERIAERAIRKQTGTLKTRQRKSNAIDQEALLERLRQKVANALKEMKP